MFKPVLKRNSLSSQFNNEKQLNDRNSAKIELKKRINNCERLNKTRVDMQIESQGSSDWQATAKKLKISNKNSRNVLPGDNIIPLYLIDSHSSNIRDCRYGEQIMNRHINPNQDITKVHPLVNIHAYPKKVQMLIQKNQNNITYQSYAKFGSNNVDLYWYYYNRSLILWQYNKGNIFSNKDLFNPVVLIEANFQQQIRAVYAKTIQDQTENHQDRINIVVGFGYFIKIYSHQKKNKKTIQGQRYEYKLVDMRVKLYSKSIINQVKLQYTKKQGLYVIFGSCNGCISLFNITNGMGCNSSSVRDLLNFKKSQEDEMLQMLIMNQSTQLNIKDHHHRYVIALVRKRYYGKELYTKLKRIFLEQKKYENVLIVYKWTSHFSQDFLTRLKYQFLTPHKIEVVKEINSHELFQKGVNTYHSHFNNQNGQYTPFFQIISVWNHHKDENKMINGRQQYIGVMLKGGMIIYLRDFMYLNIFRILPSTVSYNIEKCFGGQFIITNQQILCTKNNNKAIINLYDYTNQKYKEDNYYALNQNISSLTHIAGTLNNEWIVMGNKAIITIQQVTSENLLLAYIWILQDKFEIIKNNKKLSQHLLELNWGSTKLVYHLIKLLMQINMNKIQNSSQSQNLNYHIMISRKQYEHLCNALNYIKHTSLQAVKPIKIEVNAKIIEKIWSMLFKYAFLSKDETLIRQLQLDSKINSNFQVNLNWILWEILNELKYKMSTDYGQNKKSITNTLYNLELLAQILQQYTQKKSLQHKMIYQNQKCQLVNQLIDAIPKIGIVIKLYYSMAKIKMDKQITNQHYIERKNSQFISKRDQNSIYLQCKQKNIDRIWELPRLLDLLKNHDNQLIRIGKEATIWLEKYDPMLLDISQQIVPELSITLYRRYYGWLNLSKDNFQNVQVEYAIQEQQKLVEQLANIIALDTISTIVSHYNQNNIIIPLKALLRKYWELQSILIRIKNHFGPINEKFYRSLSKSEELHQSRQIDNLQKLSEIILQQVQNIISYSSNIKNILTVIQKQAPQYLQQFFQKHHKYNHNEMKLQNSKIVNKSNEIDKIYKKYGACSFLQ